MKKIFIIEDDNLLNSILLNKLSDKDELNKFDVKSFNNGVDFFKAFEAEKPDLVLTDIFLPQLSGTEIIQKIREDKNNDNIKIIVLSNTDRESDIKIIEDFKIKYMIKALSSPDDVYTAVVEMLS